MKTNTYLALTIGPITKTLLDTRKTRELWGASYLLSRIMREVICRLLNEDAITKENILLPWPNLFDWEKCPAQWETQKIEEKNLSGIETIGCGLFPDQLFVKLEDDQIENALNTTREITDEVFNDLAVIIDRILEKNTGKYLKDYFQLYFIVKELDAGENVIFTLSPLLDTLELQSNFPQDDPKYLIEFLNTINSANGLITEAFQNYEKPAHPALRLKKFGFDSIVEISVRELGFIENEEVKDIFTRHLKDFLKQHGTLMENGRRVSNKGEVIDRKDEMEGDKKFLTDLLTDENKVTIDGKQKEFKDLFRTYHKYIAIVQADGDNVGDILKQIGHDTEKLKDFSEKLTRFAAKAAIKIQEYGGSTVYAGGDDLLFFAPVSMVQARKPDDEQGYHVLHLLEKLDSLFKDTLADYKSFNPGLSFGVSITYYAFPMGEALEQAWHLLVDKAKEVRTKNSVALTIQKHSGNQFGGIYQIDSPVYAQLREILMHDSNKNKEIEILKSVTYKLRNSEGLIQHIGKKDDQILHFMRNSFNESIHLENGELNGYLQWIGKLIPSVYNEAGSIQKLLPGINESEKSMNQLFGLLRTVSFLKGEEING